MEDKHSAEVVHPGPTKEEEPGRTSVQSVRWQLRRRSSSVPNLRIFIEDERNRRQARKKHPLRNYRIEDDHHSSVSKSLIYHLSSLISHVQSFAWAEFGFCHGGLYTSVEVCLFNNFWKRSWRLFNKQQKCWEAEEFLKGRCACSTSKKIWGIHRGLSPLCIW